MRKQTHDFPDAKLVLVCHSHGGNVALHALQDEELRGAVAGVVCLATPFLIAARRELDDEDFDYIGLAATLLLLAMAGVVFVPLFMAGVGPLVGGWVSVAVVGVLLAIAVIDRLLRFAGARFVAKIASGVVDRLLRFAAKMVQQMALPRMDPARLLIIRSPGDEASSTLAAAQLLCFGTARVYFWGKTRILHLEERLGRVPRWKSRAVVLLGSISVIEAITQLLLILLEWTLFMTISAGLMSGMILHWAFHAEKAAGFPRLVLAVGMWVPVLLLSIALIVPFGPHLALANVFLDITAEATPMGTWEVHQVPPRGLDDPRGDTPPLAHSVYTNREAIALACDWIKALPAFAREGAVSSSKSA